jgi:diketogulonate reductase-like aldo/keto reductase
VSLCSVPYAAVKHLASASGTPTQVVLRWCAQQDLVIAKSTHREGIEVNGRIFDFGLSSRDASDLDALDRTGGSDLGLEHPWW